MKVSVICLGCMLLAGSAAAQSVGEKTGINSVVGITPTTADFVSEAAMSDMFELQSSKLATEKASDPTKAFAKRMIDDHTKTTVQLKAMVSAGIEKIALPTEMSSSQQSMLDKLKGLNGADFDKQYHSDQVSAHKDAVSLFQRYAKGGTNSELKSWASQTEPNLETHLKMAQDLDKQS